MYPQEIQRVLSETLRPECPIDTRTPSPYHRHRPAHPFSDSQSNPNPCQTFSMKRLTATICLTIAVLLGSVGVSASADFQKGLTAAQSGDFATALREWTPLAERGDASAQHNLGVMTHFLDIISS